MKARKIIRQNKIDQAAQQMPAKQDVKGEEVKQNSSAKDDCDDDYGRETGDIIKNWHKNMFKTKIFRQIFKEIY